ncbi:hypothetical protein [Pseudopedobacter beijingensis]|uniref:Uncharacterized protein n=1 Tax=Pseudopedobacter beijingensis TaxID=1207056 RepID=A0ABW4IGH6_9SPHI
MLLENFWNANLEIVLSESNKAILLNKKINSEFYKVQKIVSELDGGSADVFNRIVEK